MKWVKANHIVALTVLLSLVTANTPMVSAFGGAGPNIYFNQVNAVTQKVVAGESAVFNLDVCASEFSSYKFNVTLGLATRSGGDSMELNRLPDGFEPIYPKEFSLTGDGCYAFPLVIKTLPYARESFVDIEVLATNIESGVGIPGIANIRLFVSPLNTSLGAASKVFYEGFDNMSSSWVVDSRAGVVRAAGSSPGAQEPKYDYPGIAAPNWILQYPFVSLQLTKNAAGQNVSASRSFQRLNNSFIAEYAMKSYDGRINFTFSLVDSAKHTTVSTKFSEGNITVQNRLEGTYQYGIYNEDLLNTTPWHKFRLEANAANHTFSLYLDDKYQGTLPLTVSPDTIKIEVTCPGLCTGYVDDIFIEKIIGPSANTSIISSGSPVAEAITITTTQTDVLTSTVTELSSIIRLSTTTLSTTFTTTTTLTSIEPSMNYSTYAWAISATAAAVVLATVLLLHRRTRPQS